ncbi:glycosyltransferase [Acinetobacter sp. YWS30-1]|uniref:glycosyltransferase n=1 Tax=Acinetobacter sp. YWS30-1 TaxID=2996862 RepID=UPI002B2633DB|nr:glycosyltransferase [Acinetobacter sp. YWS30-1]WPC34791.1 glycosyltransferase [Acinetobacter sp. YWS30-1]
MKILMIIPSLSAGGAERVLSSLANDWIARNMCEIEMVVFTNVEDFYEINENIKIHRFNYTSFSKFKYFELLKLIYRLRRKILEINPDICFSFLRESNILTLISSMGLKNKIVISERDSPLTILPFHYNILRKKLYPLATGIIAQTTEYKEFIDNEINISKSIVIPNPVRSIEVSEVKREKIIINVGRLIPEKGHEYLLESFALCKKKKDWHLVLVGDGYLREKLEKKVRQLNLLQQVTFVGKSKEVDNWLCRSSIFAFSSISEGFPNALAEAMSASLPCVSFNCITGPSDLIFDGVNGFLVEVKNIQKFSERLDLLMENDELRINLGKRAKLFSENLDFKCISNQYFDYISKV